MTAASFRERLISRLAAAGQDASSLPGSSGVSDEQIGRLEQYFELLRRWNRKINLTALPLDTLEDRMLDRLFVEPLIASRFFQSPALRSADLGSGGGSPAIPLKVASPAMQLTMVESRGRKAAFLREVARELELGGVTVIADRAETLVPGLTGRFDAVTMRAVRLDEAMGNTIRALLDRDGRLFLFGTATDTEGVAGFTRTDVVPLPDPESRLWVFQRSADVPRGTLARV